MGYSVLYDSKTPNISLLYGLIGVYVQFYKTLSCMFSFEPHNTDNPFYKGRNWSAAMLNDFLRS